MLFSFSKQSVTEKTSPIPHVLYLSPTTMAAMADSGLDLGASASFSFSGGESRFADTGNLEHCAKYLNQTLVTFGFPASLDLFATDPVSIARTCNCIYFLLQQRQRDIEFRESANDQRQRLSSDISRLEAKVERLEAQLQVKEREIATITRTDAKAAAAFKAQIEKLQQERDEFQRMVIGNQQVRTQQIHEMKKREKEYIKLQVDAYEAKNQELMNENNDLRALLRSMQTDMRDFINAPNGPSKQSLPVNDRPEVDPTQSPLGGRTDLFDMPLHMARDHIEESLRNKMASIKLEDIDVCLPLLLKERMVELQDAQKEAEVTSEATERELELEAQLVEARSIIQEQASLMSKHLPKSDRPPRESITPSPTETPGDGADSGRSVFDLGAFVGDLTALDDDASSDEISLEGLEQELEECKGDDVVENILSKGTKLREYTKGVENNLRQVELDSIQDYIKESDNLVSLHEQIRDCDSILSQMETLLSGFQTEIGSIGSDIKILQEKSMDMGLRLKNRKVAESKLEKFVEDIIVPPRMVDVIIDGEVNDEYLRTLEMLSKKLIFVESDSLIKTSKALKDVQPELDKLRQKAVSKVFDFIVQKLQALRKPKTNIQILQQSVLSKYKYVISFLKEHGKEVYTEVRAAYIDTMNKVLSACFRAYIQALEKLQLDIATSSDLIGVETRSTGLFSRAREPLKNRSAVFAVGDRISILKEIEQPALIPHIAEASSQKYPYEVLFRSLHKLLLDTATSEYDGITFRYLFLLIFPCWQCMDFDFLLVVQHNATVDFVSLDFLGPLAAIDEHFNSILPNSYDAMGLMLMIRIIHQHQLTMSRRRIPCLDSYLDKVNIALWPRFKLVFDMHLSSLRNANIKTLWEDDIHPHYVMRRYAEFTASLIHLNVEYGDGQLELNMERLRMAIDDLIIKLAKTFTKPKQQIVFLINNYDMTIAVVKEAGPEGGKIQMHFEELLKSNTALFVEELLMEHFGDLIKFVKTRASEDPNSNQDKPLTTSEVEPLVKDFASRWKAAIELMHKDVITSFSNFLCGMEILRAALTQLLLYYTRLSDSIKRITGGSALNKDLISISSIMYEIRKYSRTF
ncbi:unnamed protein product [Linum tenue]|uniref:Uncharacterized protein n=1 Tax=Linum tenue TaxID=586396 RepID=A0AAV0IBI6_9ROSI|nr:unnamed protein product [Linum tenue]